MKFFEVDIFSLFLLNVSVETCIVRTGEGQASKTHSSRRNVQESHIFWN